MELRKLMQVILRGWWLVVSALLVTVTSGLVFTYTRTPIYESTATFVVSPSRSLTEFSEFMRIVDSLSKREGVMTTYVTIVTSKTVLDASYEELELTQDQIDNLKVKSELIPSTNVIKITVESDNPLTAKTVADLVGQKTSEYIRNLYEPYDMKPLDPAFVPEEPTKPEKVENLILAAMLGLLVGVGSAFWLDHLRSSAETVANVNIMDADIGVYNQHYFLKRLGEELSRAKRHQHPFSLALMKIEDLEMISNMHLPHQRIDTLRRVALRLKQYLREEDLLARFAGDKFALLLPDTTSSDAKEILEKLQDRLAWDIFEVEAGGMKLNLTATSGVATYHHNGAGRDELLGNAEKALQSASSGRIYLYDENPDDTMDKGMDADHDEPST
jgi:diguanylate cyclase (GGDEF)-like protein